MKKTLTGIAFCFIHHIVQAQELNIGIHANPTIATPILSKGRSALQEDVSMALRVGYNVGANINVKFSKASLELGANYLAKALTVTQTQRQLGFDTYYRVVMPLKAVEVPLTLNVLMHHHDNNKVYDVYFMAGAAYETGIVGSSLASAVYSGAGGGSVGFSVDGQYLGDRRYSTITPIIGFKINAVLRNVGLIDYGLSFHLPVSANGPYMIESLYNIGGTSGYKNTIYAHVGYIDIKLAYYFLNIGKDMKRIRYRKGW